MRESAGNYQLFAKVDKNDAVPVQFKIDQNKTDFETRKEFFETLTTQKNGMVKLVFILADGTEIKVDNVELFDDFSVPL